MYGPGAARCRPGPSGRESGLLIFSVLFFLLFPLVHGESQTAPGNVLVVRKEMWRLCGSVALDPKNPKWSCCRDVYPFHRPTQRCCQTSGVFVIPKDCGKSEAEDCRTYTQRTPGIHLNSKGPQEICKEGGSGQGQVHPG
uniref:Uncharacterized protein n=2 Tax=Pipistrellus kuhlii TaxID=59472 RepID=A0A7J7S0B7_PIPKU|nr:hypothetical protein mPipKuh1_010202 [Pipistrellus kuhlii]